MRIAISRHFGGDLHAIRSTWTLPELIEAHATLDYLEDMQRINDAEAATRKRLRTRG